MSVVQAILTPTIAGGVCIPIFLVMTYLSFRILHKRKDKAREGVVWLRITFPAWIIICCFYLGYGIWGYGFYNQELESESLERLNLGFHMYRMGIRFPHTISDLLILGTLLGFAAGFLQALDSELPLNARKTKRLRLSSLVSIVTFGTLIGAVFALMFSLKAIHAWHERDYREKYWVLMWGASKAYYAINSLLLICSILVIIHSVQIRRKVKENARLKKASHYFQAAALFNSLRYSVISIITIIEFTGTSYDSIWVNELYPASKWSNPKNDPENWAVFRIQMLANWLIRHLVDFVFVLVILILLFFLALRNPQHGLWSKEYVEECLATDPEGSVTELTAAERPLPPAPVYSPTTQRQPGIADGAGPTGRSDVA